MLTKNIATIQQHQDVCGGNRFVLAAVTMKRVNQLLKGARPKPGLSKEFVPDRSTLPHNSLGKLAMEEIRTGKLTWKYPERVEKLGTIDIVF